MLRTLTQKVVLVAGLFLLVVGLAAAVAIPTTSTIREATSHLAAHSLEQFHLNGHFANNVQRAVVESLAYVRTGDTDERAEAEEALADAKANLADLGAVTSEHEHEEHSAEEQAANVDGDENTEQDQFDAAFGQKYIDIQSQRITFFGAVEQHVRELLQAVDTGDQATIDRAIAALDALEDQGEVLNEAADGLNVENALAASQAVNTQIDRATYVELATFVFFALMVVVAVVALRTLIVKPIKQLSQATALIASGDLHQTVVVTSNDEVGELQHSFNQMVGHLREQRIVIDNRNQ
jgi:nitrogen fixation/metabolism regulation signal transduction histidine kinase